VGGTKTEASLIEFGTFSKFDFSLGNTQGRILGRKRIATQRHDGYKEMASRIADLCKSLAKESATELTKVQGVGIALPGSVNPSTGKMLSGNTMALIGQDLSGDLKTQLKLS